MASITMSFRLCLYIFVTTVLIVSPTLSLSQVNVGTTGKNTEGTTAQDIEEKLPEFSLSFESIEKVVSDLIYEEGNAALNLRSRTTSMELLLLITTILSTLCTFIGLIFIWKQLSITRRQQMIEIKPFLTVAVADGRDYSLHESKFKKDDADVDEIWFVIKNSGKSPAIVTGIYRRWGWYDSLPEPVASRNHKDAIYKKISLPIGGGETSGFIRSNLGQIRSATPAKRIYFDGFVEYHDLLGNRFVSGFLITHAAGRFHMAWTEEDEDSKYNYFTELPNVSRTWKFWAN